MLIRDDLTATTSTSADEDDSVRADLEAAWDAAEAGDATTAAPAAAEIKPAEQQLTDETADGRARDAQGRFIAKPGDDPAAAAAAGTPPAAAAATDPAAVAAAAAAAAPAADPAAAAAIEGRPPPGWSVQSKAAWDALPPHIRADVAKREAEVEQGFAKLREFKEVEPFANMARQSGTTLHAALGEYVGMEQLLRKDFKQGIYRIAQNMGVSPQAFAQMFGGAAPAGQPHQNGQAPAADPAAAALSDLDDPYVKAAVDSALRPVMQTLNSLQSNVEKRQQADQNREVQNAERVVNEFRSSDKYRYFANVEETINSLLAKGMVEFTGDYRADLSAAYDMACQIQPEVRDALINERISKAEADRQAEAAAAATAKRDKTAAATRAAVSVRGAPSGTVSAPSGSAGSVRADLEAAWEAHS